MRTIIALAALGFVTTTTMAQSQNDSGVASPARPQVNMVDFVEVEGGGYNLPIYVQEGKSIANKDAHFFFLPLFYIVSENGEKLKHHINDQNVLILKVRTASNLSAIENEVRKSLIEKAKEINVKFKLEENSLPYRIDPLQLSRLVFESVNKRMYNGDGSAQTLVSEPVEIMGAEVGEINVEFYLRSREEAESFVRDLEAGNDQLSLNYQFAGVSDEVCKATYEEQSTRNLDKFKEVVGEGGEGRVARHQVASIADALVHSGRISARCSDLESAESLTTRLMDRLSEFTNLEVAGWEELEGTIAIDAEDLKADIVDSVEILSKSVERDQLLAAFAEATAETKTVAGEGSVDSAREGGGEAGGEIAKVASAKLKSFIKWSDKVGLSLAGSKSESTANARKLYQDTLAKKGVHVDWDGKKFIPKSVDVYSKADLINAWGRTFAIEFVLTEGADGKDKVRLTKKSWENSISIPNGFPVGAVSMYFGNENDLPGNWKVANGQRVTDPDSPFFGEYLPDLRDKFIRGAGDDSEVGDEGGRDQRDSHTHNIAIDLDLWPARVLYCVDVDFDNNTCEDPYIKDGYLYSHSISFPFVNQDIIPRTRDDDYYALVRKRGVSATNIRDDAAVSWDQYTDFDNRPSYVAMHYIIRIK